MDIKFADSSTGQYEDVPMAIGTESKLFRSKDGRHVVKLYHADLAKDADRINRIETLIHDLNPTKDDSYWAEFFTWPEKRVIQPAIGYRMRLVHGLKTIEHFFLSKPYSRLRPEERGWFIGKVACAIKLASAANRLATMGLCYSDFSGKNIMIDPFDGRMILIDCDSITVPGKLPPTILGTSTFLAPEIVTGKINNPSVITDRHALSVIFYLWFLMWHPLTGDKNFDPDVEKDDLLRFGQEALYIEHPTDNSNRASRQELKAHVLGPEIEKLFRLAFVDGLHSPDKRPLPYEWEQAWYHTFDQIIPCSNPDCDWHFFVATPTSHLFCPRCGHPLKNPRTLPFVYMLHQKDSELPNVRQNKFNAHYLVGWVGRYLYQWHVKTEITPMHGAKSSGADRAPLAVFAYNQLNHCWLLKNLSLLEMVYKESEDKPWQKCPINASLILHDAMLIQFGSTENYFRASVRIVEVGQAIQDTITNIPLLPPV